MNCLSPIKLLLNCKNIACSFNSNSKTFDDAKDFCEKAARNGFATGRLFEPRTISGNIKVKAWLTLKGVLGINKAHPWMGVRRRGGHWIYISNGDKLGKKSLAPQMF